MDTLFRLVSLQSSSSDHHHQQQHQQQQQQQQQQQSSFNSSSRTSTSSRSSRAHHHQYQYQQQQQQQQQQAYYFHQYHSSSQEEEEECNNHHLYMDEDFSSSSSSKQHHHFHPPTNPNPNPNPNPTPTPPDFSSPQGGSAAGLNLNVDLGPRWASELLTECARAVASRDTQKVQQLMWMLNELSSPYGDTEQKVAAYFLQALFARLTSSGPRTLRTLSSASDRTASFDSTRRVALRFQELSPWSCFGHVAANGAILESFLDGNPPHQRLHILDLSNTFCTQWPTLLEALATRSADTPHLSITTVVVSSSPSSSVHRVMKEISARMEKFARLMGVPFAFHVVHHAGDLSTLDLAQLDLSDAALAINCVNALHGVPPSGRRRDSLLASLCRLRPSIVTVVEEEADLGAGGGGGDVDDEEAFLRGFRESLRFFSAYFDSLEESFPKTSNERLALERTAGRAVVDLVACPDSESAERRETAGGWSARMRAAGFAPAAFSDDVADDVRALLRRYREGWSMEAADPAGVMLAWKEQPVVWASAWKP